MLTQVLKSINGSTSTVEITCLEDLGFANNIMRMHGGFFTGINVKWETRIPFVPVDTTVNSCGVSIFRFKEHFDFSEFKNRLSILDEQLQKNGIINNFNRGNHFIALCSDNNGYQYLVLHASNNTYKYGEKGLYPREDTWYYNDICTSNFEYGYLRYIVGKTAERFYRLYLESEKTNPVRNQIVANIILKNCTDIKEIIYTPHYGMPNASSISIGSQWRQSKSVLLTKEGCSIYIVKEENPFCSFMPHGFGLSINGSCRDVSFFDSGIIINDVVINCKNGFIGSEIAVTRNNDKVINQKSIAQFMPLRNIKVVSELNQLFSYTRNGIKSFI